MWELIALGLYSVQWLGVALGVGAEVVLLCAHLIKLHEHNPQWLDNEPSVRAAQGAGLLLIVISGIGAVGYQFLVGQAGILLEPVFLFKWTLIGGVVFAFLLERSLWHARAALEGFAGATWLALFLVHTVAPREAWAVLGLWYGAWVLCFGLVWAGCVLMLKGSKPIAAAAPALGRGAAAPVAKAAPPAKPPTVSK